MRNIGFTLRAFVLITGALKNGVHIQDRGNVSLPIDMVKVLKTQDENYIRTMRLSGLKVCNALSTNI